MTDSRQKVADVQQVRNDERAENVFDFIKEARSINSQASRTDKVGDLKDLLPALKLEESKPLTWEQAVERHDRACGVAADNAVNHFPDDLQAQETLVGMERALIEGDKSAFNKILDQYRNRPEELAKVLEALKEDMAKAGINVSWNTLTDQATGDIDTLVTLDGGMGDQLTFSTEPGSAIYEYTDGHQGAESKISGMQRSLLEVMGGRPAAPASRGRR